MITEKRIDLLRQRQQREMDEIREDLAEGKARIMNGLHDLAARHYNAKARQSLSNLSAICLQIERNPEQVRQIEAEAKQAILDRPRQQYQAMLEQHHAKQAMQLQRGRDLVATRQGW